jgi:hypothetical protein
MQVRVTRWLVLWAAVAAVALVGASARAQDETLGTPSDTKLERSNKKWAQNDTCGKESFRKFPDFTVEGAAKRDAYMRECLRKHRLPPRNDLAQPQQPGQ